MSRSPSPAPVGSDNDNGGVGLDKAALHGPDFAADKRRVKEMKWDLPAVVADTTPVGFGHEAVRYEFTGELGETAPRNEALEMELFFNPNRTTMGENMEKLKYKVVVEGTFQPEAFMTVSSPPQAPPDSSTHYPHLHPASSQPLPLLH